MMDTGQWQALMEGLGFTENAPTFLALHKAYSEKHRFYHTVEHIDHCLRELLDARDLARNPCQIEIALTELE